MNTPVRSWVWAQPNKQSLSGTPMNTVLLQKSMVLSQEEPWKTEKHVHRRSLLQRIYQALSFLDQGLHVGDHLCSISSCTVHNPDAL